jgi:hypothetical protein
MAQATATAYLLQKMVSISASASQLPRRKIVPAERLGRAAILTSFSD